MENKMLEIVNLLCSNMKLDRDKGVAELEKIIPQLDPFSRQRYANKIIELLSDSEGTWEAKHGVLMGSKALIMHLNLEDEGDCDFVLNIKTVAQKLLTHIEDRVRLAAGEVFGALCQRIGPAIYQEMKEMMLKLIQSNLERNVADDDSSRLEQFETEKLVEKLVGSSSVENRANDAVQVFQETAGWKNLETNLRALQCMIEGCGTNFQPFMEEDLLSLVFRTLTHPNRFVRETGFYVCSSLFSCANVDQDVESRDSVSTVNPIYAFGHKFSHYLACGLADDWSQVRLAASVAARSFLLSLPNNGARQLFYPQLLPQMCLNRYYIADGVRIYSQETWRQVAGSAGKELVEQHLGPTVEYYKLATKSDNHAVREAACACIAELASKLSSSAVSPYVDVLLNTLLNCFQDASWPVRDAACLASGNFIQCFPNESKVVMDALYPMFYRNLSDPISSVRHGAASALCNVVRAYGEDALKNVKTYISDGLQNMKNQKAEAENFADLERGPGRIACRRRPRENESDLVFERDLYGCDSYMGRLHRLKSYDSASGREVQPWEMADGCVWLMGELSEIKEALPDIMSLVPLLREAASYHHYAHHVIFLETLCKQIPVLARNLGRKSFKMVLEDFLDAIFYSLGCENSLTSSAATQCLSQIAAFLGPNVLRARVQNYKAEYVKQLESVIYIAPY
ncbi:UNVERIFIED_CONTAM: hypothetical protein PYX00_009320 [Menopon gallinae]|uniref:IPO4/5-like TPR repeats domain-containing protein n=1 Tax=Menopon gallinae TaxID=328185 RepID=A0AAW2HAU4_9NEOP